MSDFEPMMDDDGMDLDIGTVTLTLEDDSELECAILEIFPAGGREYIALMPLNEDGSFDDSEGPLIYRYIDHGEDEEPELENIDDDDELEIACDAFDELLDAIEFDEEEEEDED